MTDKPILFSGPMIRALLDGRKSQTRRVLKPQPTIAPLASEQLEDHELRGWLDIPVGDDFATVKRLPFAIGDRLWVRETWNVPDAYLASERRETALGLMNYAATPWAIPGRWRPSIHMPRWASRLTLIVTDVRVQRLQEISEADARAEGALTGDHSVYAFSQLWDSLNADRGFGWEANPWVSATTSTVHKCNIDLMEAA